jgi:hypothetical protein
MHDAPWLVGCSFLSQNSCSAGRVPAGAERLISWEEAGSTRPLASGFSVHGVTGQSLPGLEGVRQRCSGVRCLRGGKVAPSWRTEGL